jgi:hypothetical protein
VHTQTFKTAAAPPARFFISLLDNFLPGKEVICCFFIIFCFKVYLKSAASFNRIHTAGVHSELSLAAQDSSHAEQASFSGIYTTDTEFMVINLLIKGAVKYQSSQATYRYGAYLSGAVCNTSCPGWITGPIRAATPCASWQDW